MRLHTPNRARRGLLEGRMDEAVARAERGEDPRAEAALAAGGCGGCGGTCTSRDGDDDA